MAVTDRYLSTLEVAEMFKVSPRTVQRLTHSGALSHLRVGNQIRYLESKLREFAETGGARLLQRP